MAEQTVIDALVVTLGLDASGYDKERARIADELKKIREQQGKQNKEAQEGWKKTGEAISGVKNQVLGLLAAFGATMGIKEFLTSNIQGQAQLGRLSTNLDISAKRLEAWGLVAKEMGGQASDAFSTLQNVAGGLAEAAIKGHSGFTDAARANGVVLTDSTGKLLSYEQVLVNISKRMKELPRQQAMWLAGQLGVGAMFNQLELGPEELQRRLHHAEQIAQVTAESTRRAQELQATWADVEQRFKGASEIAFEKLSPTLERLANRLADWLDSINWDKVGRGIEAVVDETSHLAHELGGLQTVAVVVGGVLATKLLTPLLGIAGALGRVGSGTASIARLGSALAAIDLTALAGVLGLAGVVYSPALGGQKHADGHYDDEVARPAGTPPGMDNASLWAKVHGQPSSFLGTPYAAALELASRIYPDKMDNATLNAQARDIVNGKWTEQDSAGTGAAVKSASMPRGARNNNPGNLNYAGQAGAHLEGGPNARFAAFGTMQEGVAALVRQLGIYSGRGVNSIQDLVNTYAPSSDGNDVGAYIRDLSKATGKGATDKLDLNDPYTLQAVVRGIVNHEGNGAYVTNQDIANGIRASDISLGSRNVAMAQGRAGGQGGNQTSNEIHIGKIEVHTPATDGAGVARDIGRHIEQNGLISQADTGLN